LKERVKRIFAQTEGLDCALFMNGVEPHLDMSFFYVTGLADGLFETGGVMIYPDGGMDLVSSLLEEPSAKKCKAPLHIYRKLDEGEDIFTNLLKGKKKVGINSEELTHANFEKLSRLAPHAEFMDISQEVKDARAVKDEQELEALKRACEIASEVAIEIPKYVKVGMTESALAAELAYLLQKKGASKPNFTLTSFGPNSAEPHYMGGDGVLKMGDFVLLDFGCIYNKYHSDITRTFVMGTASDRQKKIYKVVADAQQLAFEKMTPGADAKDVHSAVAALINATEFKGRFTHSTGHSLGLATHDGQRMFDYSLTLEPGMVFTVEPGVYLPDFGGVRIEDDVVITQSKPRILTNAPRDMIEL